MVELEWEQIGKDGMQQRAKVPGGWLVRVHENVMTHFGIDHQPSSTGYEWRVAVTFMPDPDHAWGTEYGDMSLLDKVGQLCIKNVIWAGILTIVVFGTYGLARGLLERCLP